MLTCSLQIDGLCGLPATTVLVVQEQGKMAYAFPRCAVHSSQAYGVLVQRAIPDATHAILPVQLPAAVA